MTVRRFFVYDHPHIADPAWISPVMELEDMAPCKPYSDADELARVVWKLQYDLGFNSGRNTENVRAYKFLEHIGCSPEQIKEYMTFRG
jgi:hypothetical protein